MRPESASGALAIRRLKAYYACMLHPFDPRLSELHCLRRAPCLQDIESRIHECFESFSPRLQAGSRIGIAVGSRGIASLSRVIRSMVSELKAHGVLPFVIPAMGSHGGATAEGQKEILAGYGITEEALGIPVLSSMKTRELAPAADGTRVYISEDAASSDGVILVNRIKPHTDFHGTYESGLMKMSVIGLGKHDQSLEIHSYGVQGLRNRIESAARVVLGSGFVLAGLAIVENAEEETARLELIPAQDIPQAEPKLLELARSLMPSLPFEDIDLLLVDEMGKNISGVGMDPNIIGRIRVRGQPEPESPRITSIAVFGLTAESHGNALGVGLADVTTRRVLAEIDYSATLANAVTSGFFERAKLPLAAPTARLAVDYGLRAASIREPDRARIVRIKNTLSLSSVYISKPLCEELSGRSDVVLTGKEAALFAGDDLSRFWE